MTFDILQKIIDKNNIPPNVRLTSDSGWECFATEMDGLYYNENENKIVFTQSISEFDRYYNSNEWKKIYDKEEN